MTDRKGNEYPAGVTPDEEILSAATVSTNDPVILAASKWLSRMPACQAGEH
jgi:hypothetical protein